MEKLRILLVDDEERFLSTMQKLLSRKGLVALTAASGMEALEQLNTNKIDVVILDVKMPVMDGIATLKEIKKCHPLVEVIMLTGHATIDSAMEGVKLGAIDYLMKPADIDDLIKKVQASFERRKLEETLRIRRPDKS